MTHPQHGQQDGGGLGGVLAVAQGSNRRGPPHTALWRPEQVVHLSVTRHAGRHASRVQMPLRAHGPH